MRLRIQPGKCDSDNGGSRDPPHLTSSLSRKAGYYSFQTPRRGLFILSTSSITKKTLQIRMQNYFISNQHLTQIRLARMH